jgi:hypothetical protein
MLTAPTRPERYQRNLAAQKNALKIKCHHFIPLFIGHHGKRLYRKPARIVYQNVQAAEFFDSAPDQVLYLGALGNTGLDRQGLPPQLFNFFSCGLGGVLAATVVDDNIGPCACHRHCNFPADTPAAAGHKGNLACQPHKHLLI